MCVSASEIELFFIGQTASIEMKYKTIQYVKMCEKTANAEMRECQKMRECHLEYILDGILIARNCQILCNVHFKNVVISNYLLHYNAPIRWLMSSWHMHTVLPSTAHDRNENDIRPYEYLKSFSSYSFHWCWKSFPFFSQKFAKRTSSLPIKLRLRHICHELN